MPHGGPSARDDESWDWMAQFLADRGYLVVQPNYRGSSGYGTHFAALGRGEWGRKMQDDVDDALVWLAERGMVDRARACIVGASYGGYAALRAAQRTPQLYRCAMSFAGVSDLAALSRYDRNFFNSRGRRQWLSSQAPDFREVSPLNHAAEFTIPVLLMHGDRDVVVPVSESRRMAERLRGAGKPFRYVEQHGGDHHFSRAADRLEFLRELEAFLDQHNPA
jgi:dipeptidyl aminopeptidase/acylaminoacyl peptidase